jgi:hypothetical protein
MISDPTFGPNGSYIIVRRMIPHMVRPTVESGKNFTNDLMVYLQAYKPAS